MKHRLVGTAAGFGLASAAFAEEITIATVNNGDMIIMQELSSKWEEESGHKVNWLILEEKVLRQLATTDIASDGGPFDIMTIGSYEARSGGANGWLVPLGDIEGYDHDDTIPAVEAGLSHDGTLYALPFYAESSFTMYRAGLFDEAGLEMPEQPTYAQIMKFAEKLADRENEVNGICLRGKAGWGEKWLSSARASILTAVAGSTRTGCLRRINRLGKML